MDHVGSSSYFISCPLTLCYTCNAAKDVRRTLQLKWEGTHFCLEIQSSAMCGHCQQRIDFNVKRHCETHHKVKCDIFTKKLIEMENCSY
jgi:hypothetical protein